MNSNTENTTELTTSAIAERLGRALPWVVGGEGPWPSHFELLRTPLAELLIQAIEVVATTSGIAPRDFARAVGALHVRRATFQAFCDDHSAAQARRYAAALEWLEQERESAPIVAFAIDAARVLCECKLLDQFAWALADVALSHAVADLPRTLLGIAEGYVCSPPRELADAAE